MLKFGVSDHYKGEQGREYAARHTEQNSLGNKINAKYYQPWLKKTDVVLDFGCGIGGLTLCIRPFVAEIEALEINPSAAQETRKLGFKVYDDVEQLPKNEKYDAIVSNHVFEHVPNVCDTLKELQKSLKKGGLLVTLLPIDDIRNSFSRTWKTDDINFHLQTWTPRLFANVLKESGYEAVDIKIITHAWHKKLFFLHRLGLEKIVTWLYAVLMAQRQLLVVARKPESGNDL